MRFDDRLRTILRFDGSAGPGARAIWRQLVDLAGRGRAPADETLIARLRALRPVVPVEVRAASARALAIARPDARLVAFFAGDDHAVAAPVLRTVELPATDWIALVPRLPAPLRSILRRRRDLDAEVVRALDGFGPDDLAPPGPGRTAERALELIPAMIAFPEEPGREPLPAGPPIFEMIARIDAFREGRDTCPAAAPAEAEQARGRFSFETDATGLLTGVGGMARGALVGLSIVSSDVQGVAQLDGVAPGAFRHRSRFTDARLEVGGTSSAAGSWRLSAVPVFERMTGRFTGYRGVGRRPRVEESAGPITAAAPSADSLRLLVHELRTPINAILGFAELIERELAGPVPAPHRKRATAIRRDAGELLVAIEHVETAARIEIEPLELRPAPVAMRPLVERAARDLAPLASLRGVDVVVHAEGDASALADERSAERLIGRLLATLISAGSRGEELRVSLGVSPSHVELAFDRPRALQGLGRDALFALEDDGAGDGAPLLGTSFALRLARNLARELGGALELGPVRLTLRLPVGLARPVEHATTI